MYLRFAHWLSPICNSHFVIGCLHSALLRSGSSSGFALLVDSDNWLHFFCLTEQSCFAGARLAAFAASGFMALRRDKRRCDSTPCPGVASAKTDPLASHLQNPPCFAILLLILVAGVISQHCCHRLRQIYAKRKSPVMKKLTAHSPAMPL